MKNFDDALGYDDISLLPNFSDIDSRKSVSTETNLSKNIRIKYPIILSPMDTISTVKSCLKMNQIGAAGILHRFMSVEDQAIRSKIIKDGSEKSFCAIGLKDAKERLEALDKAGADLFFLDTANGLSRRVYDFVKWYKTESGYKQDLIAGNTLTKESVSRLINVGADGVRQNIGPGAACTTVKMTGIWVPSVTALYYAFKAIRNYKLYANDWDLNTNVKIPSVLADGGIRFPKDLVKAIASGANAAICGKVFAGCNENSEEIVDINGKSMVKYKGMASLETVEQYGLGDGSKENKFSEGESFYVPFQNRSVEDVVYEFNNGLRSAMSYLNFSDLDQMVGGLWNNKIIAVKVSANSLYEGFAHGAKN